MTRVLLVAPACDGDDVGEAWFAYQWAAHLAERHDVTLLTYNKRGHRPASEQVKQARVIEWAEPPLLGRAERLNSLLKPAYLPFYLRARKWIRSALARNEIFDVAHQPVPEAMRYPSPLFGFGIPYVIGPVGGSLSSPAGFSGEADSAPWYTRLRQFDAVRLRHDPLLRRTYEGADCVLGIAGYVAEQLSGLDLKRFEIMPDTALEAAPSEIDRSGRSGPVRLLYVGRLVRTKGAQDAIRAMAQLGDIDIVLEIVGDGPDRTACEDLVAELGLEDRVTFFGRRGREEVANHYRAADVFIFPSFREPGGTVVHEAMGFGLPLIVANRGGPASSTDDSCAFRLEITTPDALARDIATGVRTLAADQSLRARMGAAGRQRLIRTALWSKKVEAVERIYEEISSTASR